MDVDAGTRSPHSGTAQRQRQAWLARRARDLLREGIAAGWATADNTAGLLETARDGGAGGGGAADGSTAPGAPGDARRGAAAAEGDTTPARDGGAESSGKGGAGGRTQKPGGGAAESSPRPRFDLSTEERVGRMELGVRLWNATYVPPIEPRRRLELIDKWSGNAARRANGGGGGDRVSLEKNSACFLLQAQLLADTPIDKSRS